MECATVTRGSRVAPAANASPFATRSMDARRCFAHFGFVGADGKLELYLVWDDVVLACLRGWSHGDEAGSSGIVFTRDDGLQRHDGARGDDDGINRILRAGAVAAATEDGDVHGIGIRRSVAGCVADLAGRQLLASS